MLKGIKQARKNSSEHKKHVRKDETLFNYANAKVKREDVRVLDTAGVWFGIAKCRTYQIAANSCARGHPGATRHGRGTARHSGPQRGTARHSDTLPRQ